MDERRELVKRLKVIYKQQHRSLCWVDVRTLDKRYRRAREWIMSGGAEKYNHHSDLETKIFFSSGMWNPNVIVYPFPDAYLEHILSIEGHNHIRLLTGYHGIFGSGRAHLLIAHGIHPRPSVIRSIIPSLSLRRLAYYMCRRHAISDTMESIKNDISSYRIK